MYIMLFNYKLGKIILNKARAYRIVSIYTNGEKCNGSNKGQPDIYT